MADNDWIRQQQGMRKIKLNNIEISQNKRKIYAHNLVCFSITFLYM